MTTSEERLSRLEGVYEHLATKADIADLRTEFQTGMERQRTEFLTEMERQKVDLIKWMISLIIGASALGVAVGTTMIKILG
jgi:hypothetical protein